MRNLVDTRPILQFGTCPSCQKEASFDLIGIQRWPDNVAKAAGLSPIQTVWQCRNCDTTLMEDSLKLDQSA